MVHTQPKATFHLTLCPRVWKYYNGMPGATNVWAFLTPLGLPVPTPRPMILDAKGNLIWMEQRWGISTDLLAQHYQGNAYLTFWAGIDAVSLGNGSYYMVSCSPSFGAL